MREEALVRQVVHRELKQMLPLVCNYKIGAEREEEPTDERV